MRATRTFHTKKLQVSIRTRVQGRLMLQYEYVYNYLSLYFPERAGLVNPWSLRPFLMQSDLSAKNGLLRLKPKSGFLTQSKKGFFDSTFSTENSDWRIQSKNSTFSTGSSSRKTQSKKFYVFFNRSHRSSHHQTHTHTATRPHTHTRYHTAVSHKALTLAWLSLLLLLAASQRGSFLIPLASSVYHPTAAARGIDPMLSTTAAPAVALAALG